MAAGNTQFKVEHGLLVQGTANLAGNVTIGGDLNVTGNVTYTSTSASDVIPASNSYTLGNTTNRWTLFASNGSFSSNVSISGTLTGNVATFVSLSPSANGDALGSTTRRWNLTANSGTFISLESNTLAVVNAAVNGTFTTGTVTSNSTHLVVVAGQVTINTGSKSTISATGNSTYSSLTLDNDVTAVSGNVAFDTDLVVLDAVNNRIGFKNSTPSSSALITVTGNVEFSAVNTGLRLQTSNASHNASVIMSGNTTNTRLTFTTFDSSNTTVKNGGFVFAGSNSTATQTLLSFSNAEFLYKTGNVVHAGNFGIYNVSGTRIGP